MATATLTTADRVSLAAPRYAVHTYQNGKRIMWASGCSAMEMRQRYLDAALSPEYRTIVVWSDGRRLSMDEVREVCRMVSLAYRG